MPPSRVRRTTRPRRCPPPATDRGAESPIAWRLTVVETQLRGPGTRPIASRPRGPSGGFLPISCHPPPPRDLRTRFRVVPSANYCLRPRGGLRCIPKPQVVRSNRIGAVPQLPTHSRLVASPVHQVASESRPLGELVAGWCGSGGAREAANHSGPGHAYDRNQPPKN